LPADAPAHVPWYTESGAQFSHLLQVALPGLSWYVPARHAVSGAAPPGHAWPARHVRHLRFELVISFTISTSPARQTVASSHTRFVCGPAATVSYWTS